MNFQQNQPLEAKPLDSPPTTSTTSTTSTTPTTPTSKIRSLLKSGFGALFGIQSNQQREQDFATGKPADFIMLGITMVVVLLIGMIWLVNSIIP